ncbi:MAG: TraB/GumN family protein, partial [Sphingomonas sp.]
MKKLLAFLAAFALASCGSPAPAPTLTDADPALWKIEDGDTTIYLFGTVHALKPG